MSAAGRGYWQRTDGLFVAQVTVRSVDGRRRRKSLYGHTAKEVMAKKRVVELEQSLGRATATRQPPRLSEFGATWVADHLTADVAGGRLAESTFAQYRDLWDRHIGPDLGHYRLDELQPPVLRQWLSRKAQATSAATGKAPFGTEPSAHPRRAPPGAERRYRRRPAIRQPDGQGQGPQAHATARDAAVNRADRPLPSRG